MRADFSGRCPRCDEAIRKGADDVMFRHGGWIHTACASGGNDE